MLTLLSYSLLLNPCVEHRCHHLSLHLITSPPSRHNGGWLKTNLIVILHASVLLASTSQVLVASPPPNLAPPLHTYLHTRGHRPKEEGIKSTTFGEHIVDKYRSSFLEKNSLIQNEDCIPQENPCISSQLESDVPVMAYPRMPNLRTHIHTWPHS
jgi:hypothetical protein